jgi:hypothetical protein
VEDPSVTENFIILFVLRNTTDKCNRPAHIGNAVHPDSYWYRGQFYFIADYLEDPEVTEPATLLLVNS